MQIEEEIRPFAPGRFPNPTVMNAYINTADIEIGDGSSEVKNVLSSGSGMFYEFSIVIKKSIYGLVVKANVLTPTVDGLFVRSGNVVAIKVCSKDVLTRIGGVSLENPVFEIGAMQDMGEPRHPNLACQFECCMDEKNIYSVLKFHQGVELFDHILNCGPLREESARCMFQQLVLGLHRLHCRGIAHRDVSLENIMYHASDHATVLIDFGLCVKLQHDPLTREFVPIRNSACGKGYFMPPESDWTGRHPQPVNPLQGDVWSAGMCLLYALLGFPPIERACDDDSRYNFLTQGRLCELLEHWDVTLSGEVVDLIQMILRPEPSERPSLAQIWAHGWMAQDGFPLPFAAQLPQEETAALTGGGARSGAHTPLAPLQQPSGMVGVAGDGYVNDRGHADHSGDVISDSSYSHHNQQQQHEKILDDEEAMCVSDSEGERHSIEDCTTRDAEGDYSFRSSVESHWSAGTTPTGRSSGSSSCLYSASYCGSGHLGIPPIGHGNSSSITSTGSNGFNNSDSVGGQCAVSAAPAASSTGSTNSSSTGAATVVGHGYNTRSRCNSPHTPGIISSSTYLSPSVAASTGRSVGSSGCAELEEGSRSPVGGNSSPAGVSGQFKVYNTRSQSFGRGGLATQPS